jgi:plastocyanin
MGRFALLAASVTGIGCQQSGSGDSPAQPARTPSASAVASPPSATAAEGTPAAPASSTGSDDTLFANAPGDAIVGQVVDGAGKPVQDAVAYVTTGLSPTATFAPPAKPLVIDQRDKTFLPGLLAVQVGTTVEFRNSDPVLHNVYSRSAAKTFDLGTYSSKDTKSTTFDKPGRIDVFCAIHTNMHTIVYVLPHPYFSVTDTRGRFEIRGVPAGAYGVRIWSDARGDVESKASVADDRAAVVRVRLK